MQSVLLDPSWDRRQEEFCYQGEDSHFVTPVGRTTPVSSMTAKAAEGTGELGHCVFRPLYGSHMCRQLRHVRLRVNQGSFAPYRGSLKEKGTSPRPEAPTTDT